MVLTETLPSNTWTAAPSRNASTRNSARSGIVTSKVGRPHAERVLAGKVGIKGSGALRQSELGRAASAGKTQLRKLQNGIFRQICRCAVFKLNFGEAVLGREGVALLQRQIDRRLFPRVAARVRDEHLPFGTAQANHPRIIGILGVRGWNQEKNQVLARLIRATRNEMKCSFHGRPCSGCSIRCLTCSDAPGSGPELMRLNHGFHGMEASSESPEYALQRSDATISGREKCGCVPRAPGREFARSPRSANPRRSGRAPARGAPVRAGVCGPCPIRTGAGRR